MWFYTTTGRCMNMNLMTGISFGTPGRIVYQQIGRTDTHSVAVSEDERLRVAHWIEDTRRERFTGPAVSAWLRDEPGG